MASSRKASRAEVAVRLQVVYQFLVAGRSRAWIQQQLQALWNVRTRQIDSYIKKAREELERVAEDKKENLLDEMLARHNEMRANLYDQRDYGGVLSIDHMDAKLLGLYAPAKWEGSGPDGGPIPVAGLGLGDLSDGELANTLAALGPLAAQLARGGPANRGQAEAESGANSEGSESPGSPDA